MTAAAFAATPALAATKLVGGFAIDAAAATFASHDAYSPARTHGPRSLCPR